MNTATVHIETVTGFSGDARCFRLDPPLFDPDDGVSYEYVTVEILPGHARHHTDHGYLYGAHENGAINNPRMQVKALASYCNPWQTTFSGVLWVAGMYTIVGP